MGFGFVEVGTVTPLAQPGNPKPRMFRLPEAGALINRLGFNNDGLAAFVANVRQARFRARGGILGLNIGKNAATPIERAADDYLALPRRRLSACRLRDRQHLEPEHAEPAHPAGRRGARRAARRAAARRAEFADEHGRKVPVFVKSRPISTRRRSRRSPRRLRASHRRRHRDQHDAGARRGGRRAPREETGGLSGPPLRARRTA